MLESGAEPDVALVEYRRPLHRSTVEPPADRAVAEFGVQRIGCHPIADGAAVAGGIILRRPVASVSHLVERTEIRGYGRHVVSDSTMLDRRRSAGRSRASTWTDVASQG